MNNKEWKEYKSLQENYYTKKDLKLRNWTDKLIEKYLIKPDNMFRNPHYKNSHYTQFFLKTKVHDIENNNEEFKEYLNKIIKNKESRKLGAIKAIKTKTDNLLKEIEELDINLNFDNNEILKIENIFKLSINSYNEHKYYTEQEEKIIDENYKKLNRSFLYRITVNFLRHELTEYENGLSDIYKRVGVGEAYELLNKKIYDCIGDKYPELKEECKRQFKMKFE